MLRLSQEGDIEKQEKGKKERKRERDRERFVSYY